MDTTNPSFAFLIEQEEDMLGIERNDDFPEENPKWLGDRSIVDALVRSLRVLFPAIGWSSSAYLRKKKPSNNS